jgi:glucosamine--fructose-6-phosphate aminotransferase (isomerizing)
MAADMAEQPAVLAGLIGRRADILSRLREVAPPHLTGVVLVARGSSDHAAVFGRYVMETACGRPVALAAPSLHTLYGVRVDYRGYLAVAVSQSGRTPEIVAVLRAARDAGARTVAITNEEASPLASVAEAVVDLGAGEELAVPATKTFTAQVAAFAILAESLGEVPWREEEWARLPAVVGEVLDDPGPGREVASAIGDASGLITVGRGYLYAVALESALKLKEAAGILAQGYSAADLRHGPLTVVERGFPVMSFIARGPAEADMNDLIGTLRGREAMVFRVAEDPQAELPIPPGIQEPLMTIPMAVRAQQVAHALALHRGLDPDAPPGLSKVTMTT